MHDQVVGIVGHLGLAEVDRALLHPAHDDAVAEGGVHQVELEVAGRVAAGRLVAGGHVGHPHEVGHARQLQLDGQVLEELVQEDHPGQVHLPGGEADHLPVEHGDRGEVAVQHVADARVAPAERGRALVGRASGRRARRTPLDERVRPVAGHPVVVVPLVGHVASQRRWRSGRSSSRKARSASVRGRWRGSRPAPGPMRPAGGPGRRGRRRRASCRRSCRASRRGAPRPRPAPSRRRASRPPPASGSNHSAARHGHGRCARRPGA